MQLNGFAPWIEQGVGLADFLFEIIYIRAALFVVERNHRSAAAEPAKGFAKRNVEIEREIAVGGTIVFQNALSQFGPRQRVGEFRGWRVGGVARPGDVIFLDEIKIDFEHAHDSALIVSTRARIFSSFAFGGTPWPRLKM